MCFLAVQYDEFKVQVRNLGANLESLLQSVSSFQQDLDAGPPTGQDSIVPELDSSILRDMCGDFNLTLRECYTLLKDKLSCAQQRGPFTAFTNIKWNVFIQSEVVRLSRRLASHNQKVRCLQSLLGRGLVVLVQLHARRSASVQSL